MSSPLIHYCYMTWTFLSSKSPVKLTSNSCSVFLPLRFGKDLGSSVGKATSKPKAEVSQLEYLVIMLIYCPGDQQRKAANLRDQVLGRALRCAHELRSAPLLLIYYCPSTHEWATEVQVRKSGNTSTENPSSLYHEKWTQLYTFFTEVQPAILYIFFLEDGISS